MSEKLFLLFTMLFCHIVDDYYLQGILAHMKQKRWWENNCDNGMYRNDYKMALAEHAFSWAFVTAIPVVVFYYMESKTDRLWIVLIAIAVNSIIHAIVDDEKANRYKINLIQDQTIHFAQLLATWAVTILWT